MLSLYAGAGLMDLGFEQEGFECVGAVEFEPPHRKKDGTHAKNPPRQWAVETWKKNRPGRENLMSNRDVRLVLDGLQKGASHVQDPQVRALLVRLHASPADVLIGGPPCQGFSLAGKRKGRFDPEKGGLAWLMIEIAALLRVTAAVFENVEGLESNNGGDDLKLLMRAWREAGYVPHVGTFNCADFGVPQTRRRIIIIAVREDVASRLGTPLWPEATHSETPGQSLLFSENRKLPWVTVRQAIGDLPEPEESWYPLNKNDAERPIGREGGVREGSPHSLHELHKPARCVLARTENYTSLPANHKTGKPPDVAVSETADGRIVANRNNRTVGVEPDAPAPAMRTDVGHGDRGFVVRVPNHTKFVRLRPEQVERVLGSGKFNPARADQPSPTIKATMHKGSQNDEPFVIENHSGARRLTQGEAERVMGAEPRLLEGAVPAPTITGRAGRGGDRDPYIFESGNTSRNGPNTRSLDEPCATVFGAPSQQLAREGVRLRRLTPRECARLQSVPDPYVFHGPLTATYRQIGNGVPPLFARHLARAVKEYLTALPGRDDGSPRGPAP